MFSLRECRFFLRDLVARSFLFICFVVSRSISFVFQSSVALEIVCYELRFGRINETVPLFENVGNEIMGCFSFLYRAEDELNSTSFALRMQVLKGF